MMVITIVLVVSMLATVAPAAVKRDDFPSSQAGTTGSSNQPVYSPSSSASASFSGSASNAYPAAGYGSRDAATYANASPQQYGADHAAAASSSSFQQQGQPGSSPGNLYYYYYPVQDNKQKENYQASSSNQYTSAVTPNFGSGTNSGSSETAQHSIEPGTGNGQDLSYSAQDLSYSAQSLGQSLGQSLNQGLSQGLGQQLSDYNGQSSNNYDQTLTNLASQLQQYGYGSGAANTGSFNAGGNSYPNNGAQTNYGSNNNGAYDASNPGSYGAASSTNAETAPSPYPQTGQIPNYGAQTGYGPQSNGQIPYVQAAAQAAAAQAYNPYGQQHFGNFAAASAPHAAFEPAVSGYRRYGLGSILMPMLALAGLSLLIPTVTSLTASGRKKRSTETSAKETALGTYLDRIERYYSIYKTAVEREECMNRIICELGDAMSTVRGKSTIFTVLEKVVPNWMGNKVGVMKNAALSGEYGKCKKFTC